jgi:hypothetical protein
MRSQRSNLTVAFCLIFAVGFSGSSAQFLAGQTVDVDTYNDELLLEGAGSYQRIVYEDAMNSTMVTNMIWSEIYVAPCGTRPVWTRLSLPWPAARCNCLICHLCHRAV